MCYFPYESGHLRGFSPKVVQKTHLKYVAPLRQIIVDKLLRRRQLDPFEMKVVVGIFCWKPKRNV